jgi:transcriptional regulator with XRE-family HTH domain
VEGELQRTVGSNLQAYRKGRGWSQEAFADVLHVHRTRMGKLERGECNLRLRTLEGIALRIDVDPVSLLNEAISDRRAGGHHRASHHHVSRAPGPAR